MSRPNINQKFKSINVENVLFECECHGDHYLEVFYEPDEKEHWLTFAFKDYPESLWSAIKWWRQGKGLWRSELMLSREDVRFLRDKLNEYLVKDLEKKVMNGTEKAIEEYGEVFKDLAEYDKK